MTLSRVDIALIFGKDRSLCSHPMPETFVQDEFRGPKTRRDRFALGSGYETGAGWLDADFGYHHRLALRVGIAGAWKSVCPKHLCADGPTTKIWRVCSDYDLRSWRVAS